MCWAISNTAHRLLLSRRLIYKDLSGLVFILIKEDEWKSVFEPNILKRCKYEANMNIFILFCLLV